MRTRSAIAVAALATALAMPGISLALDETDFSYRSTEDLYQICSAEGDSEGAVQAQLACRAYIAATVQYHDEVSKRGKMKRLICYPKGSTLADGRRAFLAWAAKNAGDAERMDEIPVVGLVRALAAAYPCK